MLRTAIVGLGNWGQHLVRSVHKKSDKIAFVSAVSPHSSNAGRFAADMGIELFTDLEAVLGNPDVDAVVVASRNSQHVDHAMRAARAGKHVFVEKPVALEPAAAERLVAVCAECGVTLSAGFNWRFHPAAAALKKLLEDGALGTILHVEGNYSGPSGYRRAPEHWRSSRAENPGGGMASRGIHIADLFISMLGKVSALCAQSGRRVLQGTMDDTTSVLMRFASGATGYLSTMMTTAELWRLQVFGSAGWSELRFIEPLARFELSTCMIDAAMHVTAYPPADIEKLELEAFAHAVREGRHAVVPFDEVLHGVAVFHAIATSAEQRGTWISLEQPNC